MKKILSNEFFCLPEKFTKKDILNLLKADKNFRIIRYFLDNYDIKKAIHFINILYKFSEKNSNTLFYINLIDSISELNNYCANIFKNNNDIIDSQGNIAIDKVSNEFHFNILYAYALKNKLILVDDKTIKENELIRKIKAGDTDLFSKWLIDNKALIYSNAKKFYDRGIDIEDLFQEGVIGVMKAIEKYDPDLNYRFSTYAVWWIKQKMVRYIYDNKKTIRVPVHMLDFINKIKKTKQELEDEFDNEPTIEDIALRIKVSPEKVKSALEADDLVVSLNSKITEEENRELGDVFPSKIRTDEEVLKKVKREEVTNYVTNSSLTKKEKEVIFLRFGLEDGDSKTLEEIGTIYGVTRERIRQIEAKALKKLRNTKDRIKVIDFMDCEPIKNYDGKKTHNIGTTKMCKRNNEIASSGRKENIPRVCKPVIVHEKITEKKKVMKRSTDDDVKLILDNLKVNNLNLLNNNKIEELLKKYTTKEIAIIVLKFGDKLNLISKSYSSKEISTFLNLNEDFIRNVCIKFLTDIKDKISVRVLNELDNENILAKRIK